MAVDLAPLPFSQDGRWNAPPTPAPLPSASAVKESDHMLPFYVGIL
jgi:hypothetical protein